MYARSPAAKRSEARHNAAKRDVKLDVSDGSNQAGDAGHHLHPQVAALTTHTHTAHTVTDD